MIWIVQEVTNMTKTATGRVVGVFNDKDRARSYARKRSDECQVITKITGWEINEELPINLGGIRAWLKK